MDTELSHHPLTGRLMPRSNGRPKGSKNKVTLLREQLDAKAAGILSEGKPTPLEVLLNLMHEAAAEYDQAHRLWAREQKRTPPKDEAAEKACQDRWNKMRAARSAAMDAAVAAAPYVHARLRSVDKTVKKGVIVTVKEFKLVGEGKRPVE